MGHLLGPSTFVGCLGWEYACLEEAQWFTALNGVCHDQSGWRWLALFVQNKNCDPSLYSSVFAHSMHKQHCNENKIFTIKGVWDLYQSVLLFKWSFFIIIIFLYVSAFNVLRLQIVMFEISGQNFSTFTCHSLHFRVKKFKKAISAFYFIPYLMPLKYPYWAHSETVLLNSAFCVL